MAPAVPGVEQWHADEGTSLKPAEQGKLPDDASLSPVLNDDQVGTGAEGEKSGGNSFGLLQSLKILLATRLMSRSTPAKSSPC